jgi:hypothetical protein
VYLEEAIEKTKSEGNLGNVIIPQVKNEEEKQVEDIKEYEDSEEPPCGRTGEEECKTSTWMI